MRKITNSSRMELMAMEALKTRSFMIYTSSKTGLGGRDKVKSYTSVLPKRRTVGKNNLEEARNLREEEKYQRLINALTTVAGKTHALK